MAGESAIDLSMYRRQVQEKYNPQETLAPEKCFHGDTQHKDYIQTGRRNSSMSRRWGGGGGSHVDPPHPSLHVFSKAMGREGGGGGGGGVVVVAPCRLQGGGSPALSGACPGTEEEEEEEGMSRIVPFSLYPTGGRKMGCKATTQGQLVE